MKEGTGLPGRRIIQVILTELNEEECAGSQLSAEHKSNAADPDIIGVRFRLTIDRCPGVVFCLSNPYLPDKIQLQISQTIGAQIRFETILQLGWKLPKG